MSNLRWWIVVAAENGAAVNSSEGFGTDQHQRVNWATAAVPMGLRAGYLGKVDETWEAFRPKFVGRNMCACMGGRRRGKCLMRVSLYKTEVPRFREGNSRFEGRWRMAKNRLSDGPM